jgi:hypothetical protein
MSILQKFLAQFFAEAQARAAMRRAIAGSGLVIALFCAIALSASPQLHERVHPDAKQPQHECVITLITAGNVHHAAPAPLCVSPVALIEFFEISRLNPVWVPSPFLSARIFEHAPPRSA